MVHRLRTGQREALTVGCVLQGVPCSSKAPPPLRVTGPFHWPGGSGAGGGSGMWQPLPRIASMIPAM
jgi:hypothetical protein